MGGPEIHSGLEKNGPADEVGRSIVITGGQRGRTTDEVNRTIVLPRLETDGPLGEPSGRPLSLDSSGGDQRQDDEGRGEEGRLHIGRVGARRRGRSEPVRGCEG
jgi:hypothetical protein